MRIEKVSHQFKLVKVLTRWFPIINLGKQGAL